MADWHIDYSAARPSGSTIKSTRVGPAGEYPVGVIRYVDAPDKVQTKHATPADVASLRAAGLRLDAMYFEIGTNDPLGGYNAGRANAIRAKAGADWLGFNGVILFCCDRWMAASATQPVAIPKASWQAYLDGAVSILGRGRTGAYGFFDAMDAAVGHVDYFVQCGSRSVVRSFVHGWQDNNVQPVVGGIATDRVLILKPFATQLEEDDMTPEELLDTSTKFPNGEWHSIRQMVQWTFDAAKQAERIDDIEVKTSAVIQALNALGVQLAAALTTINTQLTEIEGKLDNPASAQLADVPVSGTLHFGQENQA